MIASRPSICIYTNESDKLILREICSGIEEEGIFYEISERDIKDLNQLAWDAANKSTLGSGRNKRKKHCVSNERNRFGKKCRLLCRTYKRRMQNGGL